MKGPFSASAVRHLVEHASPSLRKRIVALLGALVCVNIGAWLLAIGAFSGYPLLLGTALIAYTFGLRHAVDADHIAAIDNVTRKLMQERKRPVAVGLFFSLGHSTVVVALSVAIALAASVVKRDLPSLQSAGGVIGTSISAAFLFAIAVINLFVLLGIVRAFRAARRGAAVCEEDVNAMLDRRGLIGRFFRPVFDFVDTSWKMYPVGLLFGLGFDTASEIGLLGIAAVEAGKGLPVYDILIFPLLFAAGMSLLDTADGMLMLGAYGWAFVKPMRKLYYNMVITCVSVLVAVAIGTIEVASTLVSQLHLRGEFWNGVGSMTDQFGVLGYVIVGIFAITWIVSAIVYKLKGYDDIDVTAATERI